MNGEQILNNLKLQIKEIKKWIIGETDRGNHIQASYFSGRLEALEGVVDKIEKGFWKI